MYLMKTDFAVESKRILPKDPEFRFSCKLEAPQKGSFPEEDFQRIREEANATFAASMQLSSPSGQTMAIKSGLDTKMFITSDCAKHPSGECTPNYSDNYL